MHRSPPLSHCGRVGGFFASLCRYGMGMGRRALEPGEGGKTTFRGRHPKLGLWIGEAAPLRRQDVDLAAGAVTVAGKLIRVRGQGRVWDPTLKSDLSYRTLPIREGARGALERRLAAAEERGGLQYLFAPPGASKPDTDYWQRLARGVFDRAELPDVTAHTLRRTVERELEQAGATVSERETFMGHTERVARMHYADHGVVRQSIITAMDKSGVSLHC